MYRRKKDGRYQAGSTTLLSFESVPEVLVLWKSRRIVLQTRKESFLGSWKVLDYIGTSKIIYQDYLTSSTTSSLKG